jgi:hypothetical protein
MREAALCYGDVFKGMGNTKQLRESHTWRHALRTLELLLRLLLLLLLEHNPDLD